MSRYRSEGPHVYQGEKRIITCEDGDQGQKAAAIAKRVASLLNADFRTFCAAVCDAAVKGACSIAHGPVTLAEAKNDLPLDGC